MNTYLSGGVNQMHEKLWRSVAFLSLALSLSMFAPNALSHATGFSPPKECASLGGEIHVNCLYSYIERQRQNNAAVGPEMIAQDGIMEQVPARQTQVDQLTPIADEGVGEVDRAGSPQEEASPGRSPDTITPGVGSPTECRAYSRAAHLNCLYAYIEIQQSKRGKVEEELNAQKQMLGQLRDQIDRQASTSQDLQRRLAERDGATSSYLPPPMYPYPGLGYSGFGYPGFGYPRYGYSGPGLSLYLGTPGYYWGGPFYGPRFFGHRFGHHHR